MTAEVRVVIERVHRAGAVLARQGADVRNDVVRSRARLRWTTRKALCGTWN